MGSTAAARTNEYAELAPAFSTIWALSPKANKGSANYTHPDEIETATAAIVSLTSKRGHESHDNVSIGPRVHIRMWCIVVRHASIVCYSLAMLRCTIMLQRCG